MSKIKNFFIKIKPSKRKLIQLYSALLHNAHIKGFVTGSIFTGSLKNICGPGFNCYSCPGATLACPLGSIQNALAESKTKVPTYVLGIILLYCIILGRTICGYLCPAGLLQELLYKIKTPKLKKSQVTRVLSYTKYVLLFVLVIGVPLMYALQENNIPVPGFCKYVCPIGTFEGGVFLLIPNSNAEYFSMLGGLFTWKFMIMLIFILASIFIFRFFCRFLCPLGAIYGLFNRLSIIGVKVDKAKCTNCHACVNFCKMDVKEVGDHECINCGECIDVCEADAIKWKNILREIRKEKELEATFTTDISSNAGTIEYQMINSSPNETTSINLKESTVQATEEKPKKTKNTKKIVIKVMTFVVLLGVLVVLFVLSNFDFSKKLYTPSMILDNFTTKLYSDKEFNLAESDAKVTMLYFYDDFDLDTFKEIDSIADNDNINIVLISKFDDKDEYKKLVEANFSTTNILFGYDSVNQTEIAKFVETSEYPFIVILDSTDKIIVAEQNKYDNSYYTDYIGLLAGDVVVGNEVGNYCITQDINLISDDSKINISDYKGKIVVLNFWYIECAPCKMELPHFSAVNSEYDEVEVIAVSNNWWYKDYLDGEPTREFIKNMNYDLTFAYDNEGETYTLALFGKTDAYPMTIIIDQEGYIRFKRIGSVSEEELRSVITSLLS